ncbi:tetratricopeptide repeat protein [Pelatocladus sp. BLCC-F211]|uniref:tetratricopeptide repeat protein n=1 Tax=Pelatocladus sp. BLCC-F211 TaxID=3342752 RepID=UPI0035BB55C8
MRLSKFFVFLFTLVLAVTPQIAVAQTYEQLIQQGKNASASEDFAQAEAIWREALRRKPKDPDVWVFLGRSLRLQGKLDEALATYKKAIELNPRNPYAWNGLGNTLGSQENKLDEAETAYRKAIQIDPHFSLAYNNLGNVFYVRNNIPDAIAAYKKAIELDPDDVIARNNLDSLQRELASRQNLPSETYQQKTEIRVRPSVNGETTISVVGNDPIVIDSPDKFSPPPLASVVKIAVKKSTGTTHGTGWILTKQGNRVWIITNRHLVTDSQFNNKPSKEVTVQFYSANQIRPPIPAKITNITKENDLLDLAVLEVIDAPISTDIQALQMASTNVSLNTTVRVIGHPNIPDVSDWTPDTGEITSIANQRLQISKAALYIGHSGSPVLDKQNNVVGVVYNILSPGPEKGNIGTAGYGFAHPIELVKNQLRTWGYEL